MYRILCIKMCILDLQMLLVRARNGIQEPNMCDSKVDILYS